MDGYSELKQDVNHHFLMSNNSLVLPNVSFMDLKGE